MSEHGMVRALFRKHRARWKIAYATAAKATVTEHQQWALFEDGKMYGIWPDPQYVVILRDMRVLYAVIAEVTGEHPLSLSNREIIQAWDAKRASDGFSVEAIMRAALINKLTDRVIEKMGV